MISAVRYCVTLLVLTAYYGSKVVVAALLGIPFRPGGVYDEAPRRWARLLLKANRLKVATHGLDRLRPGQPYVFAANHFSFVDAWVLADVLPGSVRFLSKRGLAWVPLLGAAMKAAGHIFVDRRNLQSALSSYDAAARVVRSGRSAVVFAEGTRSRDGRLQAFKKGPFVLAIVAGVPVAPVRIDGTFEVLPKGSVVLRPHPIRVRIGDPIPTEGLGYEDREALAARCRDAVMGLGETKGNGEP